MKGKKKKAKIIFIFILIIGIFLIIFYSRKYNFLQEDLLFFQFLNQRTSSESDNIIYAENQTIQQTSNSKTINSYRITVEFAVTYQNTKLKAFNLMDTVDNKTLVYEKIAPGTGGGFDIVLKSTQEMNYQVYFESKNEKPTNLQFYMEDGIRYGSLEELGASLQGTISKNGEIIIPVFWEWVYEISDEQNEQDTEEAKQIREYNFLIYVKGY